MDKITDIYTNLCKEIIKQVYPRVGIEVINKSVRKTNILKAVPIEQGFISIIEDDVQHKEKTIGAINLGFKKFVKALYLKISKSFTAEEAELIFQKAYLKISKEYGNTPLIDELSTVLPDDILGNIILLKKEGEVMGQIISFMKDQFNSKELIQSYLNNFEAVKKEEEFLGYTTGKLHERTPATKLGEIFEKGY